MIRSLLVLVLTLGSASAFGTAEDQSWRFRVWLGDREIGEHQFTLQRQDGALALRSEASFEYRMLFVKLYEYQHENSEVWDGDCLRRLESHTDANGRVYHVKGELGEDQFVLSTGAEEAQLPACVMTFAYWNPAFLKQERLLNAQNGEFVDVTVSPPQPDRLLVRGDERPALRYRLTAGDLDIDLWYSEDDQWLALETEARGGRRLRYELL